MHDRVEPSVQREDIIDQLTRIRRTFQVRAVHALAELSGQRLDEVVRRAPLHVNPVARGREKTRGSESSPRALPVTSTTRGE